MQQPTNSTVPFLVRIWSLSIILLPAVINLVNETLQIWVVICLLNMIFGIPSYKLRNKGCQDANSFLICRRGVTMWYNPWLWHLVAYFSAGALTRLWDFEAAGGRSNKKRRWKNLPMSYMQMTCSGGFDDEAASLII